MARRWLVDAMNVIGSRPDNWWSDQDRAMRSLAEVLDDYARITGDEVIVVFDKTPKPPPTATTVRLVYASRKGRNAADHEIVELVARDENPRGLRVVTSDKALGERVTALGAGLVRSRTFRDRVERVRAEES
ncbi:MAG: NYN domain-containing protein [Actinomycetota bacterium]